MIIKHITQYLESIAPLAYQESYDNSGLLTGHPDWETHAALITLDCTEAVVDEAIAKKCNLIIAHHPIIFKGLKKLTGSNYVERTVIKAIENKIAIYAIHTNLDNAWQGVNQQIAQKLELKNTSILQPIKNQLAKIVTFVPENKTGDVLNALHKAGAGNIGNYSDCSFKVNGIGTFKPNELANPSIGQANQQEWVQEDRIELIFPVHTEKTVIQALHQAHPYEVPAYYIHYLENENQEVGAGMVGELSQALSGIEFLKYLKEKMNLQTIRHTALLQKPIKKVAVCGGSGSFLLKKAISAGADAFISADFKYHEFFDAENKLLIADIGHYESEVYTKDWISALLTKKFPTFAVNFSGINTNPISYYH